MPRRGRRCDSGGMAKGTKDGKVVVLHGFTGDEALQAMRAVKAALGKEADIAFSMTTETNKKWKLADLLAEVRDEHEYMKANPPGSPPGA